MCTTEGALEVMGTWFTGCGQCSDFQVRIVFSNSAYYAINTRVCKCSRCIRGMQTSSRERTGAGGGGGGFSVDISIHSLKTASKYMKILANFQLRYMDIMSYFLNFSVFFKIRMEVMVGTLHL